MELDKTSKRFINAQDISWELMDTGVERKILCYNQDLMMTHVRFQKGGIGQLHHHPHRQVSFVESGAFEVEIEGEKKILYKGDSFIVEADLIHGVVALEDGALVDVFTPHREDFL